MLNKILFIRSFNPFCSISDITVEAEKNNNNITIDNIILSRDVGREWNLHGNHVTITINRRQKVYEGYITELKLTSESIVKVKRQLVITNFNNQVIYAIISCDGVILISATTTLSFIQDGKRLHSISFIEDDGLLTDNMQKTLNLVTTRYLK